MHGLTLTIMVMMAGSASAAPAVWSAACFSPERLQYQQTINGPGYVHAGTSTSGGQTAFDTVRLKQSYFDGNMVCGRIVVKTGPKELGAVCADNKNQNIRIETGAQVAQGISPEQAPVYCKASVTILQ
jgi:hypothetical protein